MKNKDLVKYISRFVLSAIVIICFTILAIVFNHWWIIFFTFIFWSMLLADK